MDYDSQIASLRELKAKYQKDLVYSQQTVAFYDKQLDQLGKLRDAMKDSVVIDDDDVAYDKLDELYNGYSDRRKQINDSIIPDIQSKIEKIDDMIADLEAAKAAAAAASEANANYGDVPAPRTCAPNFSYGGKPDGGTKTPTRIGW